MVSIGTLEIAIKADMSDYNRARKTLEQDQGLKFHIVPTVDHKNLVALNRHFSEKEDHHKKVQKGFNQNPLTPKVDLRELNSLTKAYQDLSRLKGNLTSGSGTIHFAVEHTYKVDIRESNRDIAHQIKDLGSGLRDIVAAVKSTKQGIVGKAVGGLIGAVTSTPLAIARGAFERVGSAISDEFATPTVKKVSGKVKKGAKVIQKEVIGDDFVAETFLAELLRSGDVNKASSEAFERTKVAKYGKRLEKLKSIVTVKGNDKIVKALDDAVSSDSELRTLLDGLIGELNKERSVKGQKTLGNGKIAKLSVLPDFIKKAQPTEIGDNIVKPFVQEMAPFLKFVEGMQAYNTKVLAQRFYNERKAGFPKLGKDENVVSLIGGAQNEGGQGSRKIAPSMEFLSPNTRFMPVENLETDATNKSKQVDDLTTNIIGKFAPELVKDKEAFSTFLNAGRQVAFAVNPLASSTAAAQSIANTKLAQEQGSRGSVMSYSLGGADAVRFASTANYMGIKDAPALAMAYPYMNWLGNKKPEQFKSTIVENDPLTFPIGLKVNKPTPQLRVLETDGKAMGADAHGPHHLFKKLEFLELFFENLGKEIPDLNPNDVSEAQKNLAKIMELLSAAEHSKSLRETGDFNYKTPYNQAGGSGANVFAKLFESKKTVENLKKSPIETVKQIGESLDDYFAEIRDAVIHDFKLQGVKLPENVEENFQGFVKYSEEVVKANNILRSFKTGKTHAKDGDAYFAGGLNHEIVQQRLPILQDDTIKHFSGETGKEYGIYQEKLVAIYSEVEKVAKEFVATKGKLPQKTKDSISHFEEPKIDGWVKVNMDKVLDRPLPKEEEVRIADWDIPKAFKNTQSTILAYNKLLHSLKDILPSIKEFKAVAFGMSGAAALITENIVYKTDLDPKGANKIAGDQEIKAYQKLQGRLSPLLYHAVPGEALVTERMKGRPLKEILDRIAKPILALQSQRESLIASLEGEDDENIISSKQSEIAKISASISKNKTRFNKAAKVLYEQVGSLGSAMQSMGVMHNDLASGNVFFGKGGPKAIDLGNSTIIPKGKEKSLNNIWDEITTHQRAIIDKQFYGILDPLTAISAIRKGYSTPLAIPAKREIDQSLLSPENKGIEVPLGTDKLSLLQEKTGKLSPLPTKAIREEINLSSNSQKNSDPWSDNYDPSAITSEVGKKAKRTQRRKVEQEKEINPFGRPSFATKNVKSPDSFTDLIKVNKDILSEIKSIKSILLDVSKEVKKTPNTKSPDVVYGEFVDPKVSGGLSKIENNSEVGLFQKMMRSLGNIAVQHYGVAKGIEKYAFDTVQILSVGLVNLHAAKKVTQAVAPAIALGMAGHNVPLLGAGMDAISSGVITPLLGHGIGAAGSAAGSGLAGMLPNALTTGAATLGGWLGHLPGATALGTGIGQTGAATLGGVGTALTYLLGGRAATLGGQFALNQAVKPLGLLPSASENKTYNALTGIGNFVGNLAPKKQPLMLPPRPVEYAHAELLPRHNEIAQSSRLALPPSGGFEGKTLKDITELSSVIDRAVSDDNLDLIQDIKNRTKLISNSFKDFYAELGKSIKKNQLDFARVQSLTLLSTSEVAKQEINKMLANLKDAGLNTGLGTSGVSSGLHGLKGNLTKWEKGTGKKITEIDKLQAIDVKSTATDAIAGLTNAVGANLPEVNLSGQDIGEALKKGVDISLDSHSPSKEMIKRGEWAGQGLEIGANKSFNSNVFIKIGEKAVLAYEAGLNGAAENIQLLKLPVPELEKDGWVPELDEQRLKDVVKVFDFVKMGILTDTEAIKLATKELSKEIYEFQIRTKPETVKGIIDKGYLPNERFARVRADKVEDAIRPSGASDIPAIYGAWIRKNANDAAGESYGSVVLNGSIKPDKMILHAGDSLNDKGQFWSANYHNLQKAKLAQWQEKKPYTEGILFDKFMPNKISYDTKGFKGYDAPNHATPEIVDLASKKGITIVDYVKRTKDGEATIYDSTKNISKYWDKTAAHISEKMDEIGKKSAEVGYDVQHELAEGSPGLTQRIRDYWDKTVKHIQGRIGELSGIDTSNLEPKTGLFGKLREQFPIIDQGIEKLRTLKSTIVTLGAAGLGIIGLVLIGKQLSNIAIESVKVYRNFESIFIASKMIKNGDQFLGDVRKQVQALGGDLESTMRQGQQFVTGLQGTNLERNASSMFLDSSKALKSLGLQNQQYDSAILAIKQTASKGRVSLEEISGQLGESVPGALNIAAQAMQTNVQGFIQLVESGNLLSEEFLPKFIAKLKSQTAFLEPEIKKSLNASLGRLGASQTELQVGINSAISPAIIPTIDLISKGINLLNDNMDKAVITAQVLAVALAMPAAKQGILLIGKAWQFVTANIIVAKTAADALNQSLMIGKTLLTGGLYVGAAMAITSVIQGAMYLMEGGSKNIKDLNDVIDSSSNAMADNYARAYGFAEKLEDKARGTGNFLLDGIDGLIKGMNDFNQRFTPFLPNLETYEGARKKQDNDNLDMAVGKIESNSFYSQNLGNPEEVKQYLIDSKKLEDARKTLVGQISVARMTDPVGNEKLINSLQDQLYGLNGLVQKKEELDNRFVTGGASGIEQSIKNIESAIQEAKDLGRGDLLPRLNQELMTQKSNLEKIKDINQQVTSGLNDQRLAYIELNAEIARGEQLLQSRIVRREAAILARQAKGEIGSNFASNELAKADFTSQNETLNRLINSQKSTLNYLRTRLDVGTTTTIEGLIKKKISQADAGDLSKAEALIAADNTLKQSVSEQGLTALKTLVDNKAAIDNAKKAIQQSGVSLLQANQGLADQQREFTRSLEDWNLEMKRQAIDTTQQIESYRREVEDAGISASRENRDLAESFSDLMFDLQTQLKTAQNEFIDIQDRIKNTKFKNDIESTSPYDTSIGKKFSNIFASLFDKLSGSESESRKLEMEQQNIGKEYVSTLRNITREQEKQFDAEKNRTRALVDMANRSVVFMMEMQQKQMSNMRNWEDKNRQNNRENRGMAGFKENQFSRPQAMPQMPVMNQSVTPLKPITVQSNLLSNIQKSQGANIQPITAKNNIVRTRNDYDPSFHLPALNEELSVQEQFNQQVPPRNTPQPIQTQSSIPVSFAQPAPISVGFKFNMKPDELEMMKRLVLAEAGGEGIEGQAAVARAIFNRQTMVNKHGISPGTYFAKSGSLQDIMTARSPKTGKAQFSPFDDGRINKPFTPAQLAQAEAAIAIAQDPNSLRNILQRAGLNPSQATKAVNATGFRNTGMAKDDPSQNHNTVQLRNHRFNGDQFSKNKLRAFNFGMPTEYENVAGIGDLIQTVQKGINTGLKKTGELLAPIIPNSFKLPKADGLLERTLGIIQNTPVISSPKKWTWSDWVRQYVLYELKTKKDVDKVITTVYRGNIKDFRQLEAWLMEQKGVNDKVWKEFYSLWNKKSPNTLNPPKQPTIKKQNISAPTRPVVMPKVEEPRLENARLQKNNQLTPSSLFSGEMVSLRKRKIEDLLQLVAHIEGEDKALITKGVVDALNSGQLGKTAKFEWLGLTQQQVENYIKLSDKDRDAYIKKILSKPKSKPRLTPVINEVLKLEAQQIKNPIPQEYQDGYIQEQIQPNQPIQQQVYQPIQAPVWGGNTPIDPSVYRSDFTQITDYPSQIYDQKLQNNQASQELTAEQKRGFGIEAKNQIILFQKDLEIALRKTNESIRDQAISTQELIQNSKGYLTVQEEITKAGNDVATQYLGITRSITDQVDALQREVFEIEKNKRLTKEEIDLQLTKGYITQQQADQFKADTEYSLTKAREGKESQIASLEITRKEVAAKQNSAKASAEILRAENLRIEALTKIADLEANIATARYNQGGTLINEASIIKARIDGIKMLRDAERAYKEDNSLGSDYVTKTKELADINLSQSYVDAIPFLKDFSTGLKDVVLRTSTWQESLKKLLDLANSTVIDQFLIKPFQNMIAGVAESLGLFKTGKPQGMNAPKVASELIQNNIVPTGQFGVGSVSQDQIVTDSLKTFNDALGNSSEVIPSAIQSITDGSITQGVAISLFTQGLIQATLALQSFALAAGGQSVSSGLGGIFGGLFNSGNASTGASLGGALLGGYSGIMQGILPFAKGGPIVNRAEGGPVTEIGMNAIAALQKEKALNGGQPTALIAATVGEYVLTKEQASDYLAEKENAHRWNNLQSQNTQIMNRAQGGSVGNVSSPVGRGGTVNNIGGDTINISLASPNDMGYTLGQLEKRGNLQVERSVKRFS
jgi:tape measure domain-containing protein